MPKPLRTAGRAPERGSVLPAVLALTVGVGALTTGYFLRNLREHGREAFDRDSTTSLYDAWAQMEVVTRIVNSSGYDAAGRNQALMAALARPDGQFIDADGWPTGVTVVPEGGAGSGFYSLVSTARTRDAVSRVTALVRERQSFADFNYFVNSHPLGISGGQSPTFPYADAPEGSIHSNDKLIMYFADRHFRDPVTAVKGFDYTAGARGPNDPKGQNNWFHGPTNDEADAINGLTDVDIAGFTDRADNLLSLSGDWDFAKVQLRGPTARVEHWQTAHQEQQDVTTWQKAYHYETRTKKVPVYAWKNQPIQQTRTLYKTEQVWTSRQVPYQVLVKPAQTVKVQKTRPVYQNQLVKPAWTETVTKYRTVTKQVWVPGGGGGDTGGGGSGDVGYWKTVTVQEPYTETINHPAEYKQVQVGTETYWETQTIPAVYETRYKTEWYWKTVQTPIGTETYWVDNWVQYVAGYTTQTYQVKVSDGWKQVTTKQWVNVPERKVATYDLNAAGTVYVKGDIYFQPMEKAKGDPYDVHVLDGSMSFASDDDVLLQDSIVYGVTDGSGVLQTAYKNGADHTQPYVPNDKYTGSSVLGIIARDEVVYTKDMPDQSELNATFLAKLGQVAVEGVTVNNDGSVSPASGGWVKMSLRRLGGITSNRRPVSTYVDKNNAVTRGFVYGKSVFDRRQLTNAPRGFPTLNRPRILATVLREVR